MLQPSVCAVPWHPAQLVGGERGEGGSAAGRVCSVPTPCTVCVGGGESGGDYHRARLSVYRNTDSDFSVVAQSGPFQRAANCVAMGYSPNIMGDWVSHTKGEGLILVLLVSVQGTGMSRRWSPAHGSLWGAADLLCPSDVCLLPLSLSRQWQLKLVDLQHSLCVRRFLRRIRVDENAASLSALHVLAFQRTQVARAETRCTASSG